MRASRKRFIKPKQQRTVRRKAVGDGTATSRYMHNEYGRAAMRDALAEQRAKQNGLCGKCQMPLAWGDTRFEFRECPDGTLNRAIHKSKCPERERLSAWDAPMTGNAKFDATIIASYGNRASKHYGK